MIAFIAYTEKSVPTKISTVSAADVCDKLDNEIITDKSNNKGVNPFLNRTYSLKQVEITSDKDSKLSTSLIKDCGTYTVK